MTGEELRESALAGAGPRFRGRTLRVAWAHYSILQQAGHPVAWTELPAGEIAIDQVVELAFVLAAEFEIVYAAAFDIGAEGKVFNSGRFEYSAAAWEVGLDDSMTLEEFCEFRKWLPVLHGQIVASRSKSIDTRNSPAPPDSGN